MVRELLLCVLTTIVGMTTTAIVTYCVTKSKNGINKYEALEDGVLSLLRSEMVTCHRRYVKQGYCSINDKEVVEKMYIAYHNLGGNGVATALHDEIMELPSQDIYK